MVSGREDRRPLLSLEGRAKLRTVIAVSQHGRKGVSDQGVGAHEARAKCLPAMLGRSATVVMASQGSDAGALQRPRDGSRYGPMAPAEEAPRGSRGLIAGFAPFDFTAVFEASSHRWCKGCCRWRIHPSPKSGDGAGAPPCFMPTNVRREGRGNH
jgi:hypothetical protein